MKRTLGFFAIPWIALAIGASASGATIRDEASMFKPEVVQQALATLKSVEKTYNIPITIETIERLRGQSIDEAALERARRSGERGLFVLISEGDSKIEVLNSSNLNRYFNRDRRIAIRDSFVAAFKQREFDRGLLDGTAKIESTVAQAMPKPGAPGAAVERRAAQPGQGGFGLGTLLMIGVVILAVLFGIRLLGSLFGGASAGYGSSRMGGPGYGPGGPGYGPGGPGYGPGYGGGGGGFLSGLFGGLGGAIAGNWIYDQFRGNHHGNSYQGSTHDPNAGSTSGPADGGDGWSGTGESADWGGGGGGDWGGGGGDWGDSGGGGDWGGGGDGGSW